MMPKTDTELKLDETIQRLEQHVIATGLSALECVERYEMRDETAIHIAVRIVVERQAQRSRAIRDSLGGLEQAVAVLLDEAEKANVYTREEAQACKDLFSLAEETIDLFVGNKSPLPLERKK